MFKSALLFFAIFVLFPATAIAWPPGSIQGGVYDSAGNPMIGAVVMVHGTSYGAMTDGYGEYRIDNLPPEIYSLQANMVGMSSITISDIEVRAGETAIVDFGRASLLRPTHPDADIPSPPDFDDNPQSGRFQAATEDGVVFDLPLEHTEVDIRISGCMQLATVRQVFGNPAEEPIEAVYTFPLPENGAVNSMNMYIGDRFIRGLIYPREQAEQVYNDAIESGRTASMLSQERPNIFTQNVGNILPGDSITIEITYVAPVHIDKGVYEILFPTVVGPRFIPGEPIDSSSSGWSPPTDEVPDADRITPPVIPEGLRSGYDIDISVTINAGLDIHKVESINHEITREIENGYARVELVNTDEIPNRDFIVRYDTGADEIETALLTHEDDRGSIFMLIVQPEVEIDVDRITPKEIFFVVDCSGSMNGAPISAAKDAMRVFVTGMNPDDTFQIMRFSEIASSMSDEPLENNHGNVERGLEYIENMSGGGGTNMIEGVRAAIGYPQDSEKLRYVIFLTDGYIGNETTILSEIRSTLGENIRFFSVGIGSSVNRYLIEGMAEEGRGQSFYISRNEEPSVVVETIFNTINNPYIMDFKIEWGDIEVFDVYPEGLADIYPGETLFFTGRYAGEGLNTIRLNGLISLNEWEQEETLLFPYTERENEAIAVLWARSRIHEMERHLLTASYEDPIISEITSTALLYNILSDYTSFVAVSEEVRIDSAGKPLTVQVPVNMPEGVGYEGVFGTSTPPQGATTIQYGSSNSNALTTSSVGCTSIAGIGRIESRTMPVVSVQEFIEPSGNPRVIKLNITPYLGLTDYLLTLAFLELEDELLEEYKSVLEGLEGIESIDDCPQGIIAFDIYFNTYGQAEEVSASINSIQSEELTEAIPRILLDMEIPPPPEGAGIISITLKFELT